MRKTYSISALRVMVREKREREVKAEILKLKLKLFPTQEDKAKIQKLQQKLNG